MSLLAFIVRLRRQGAAVALEAILCIAFMLGAFYVMWGASLIVYNQSKMLTGSEMAAEGAVTVYDRSTYRGFPVPGQPATDAFDSAQNAAQSLFNENGAVGMALDQFTSQAPTIHLTEFQVICNGSISAAPSGSYSNCTNSPLGTNGGQVTYITVGGQGGGTYWLLDPLLEGGGRNLSDQKYGFLTATASSLSVGPGATP